MYSAIKARLMKSSAEEQVLLGMERKVWKKRLLQFSIGDKEKFLWNGAVVPTMEEMDKILLSIHWADGKHCRDLPTLRKALSEEGYTLPKFCGGLERACTL